MYEVQIPVQVRIFPLEFNLLFLKAHTTGLYLGNTFKSVAYSSQGSHTGQLGFC